MILEKYKPTKSLDYIGHFKFVNDFKQRLKQNDFSKIIVCIGYTGIGKTSLIKQILKELNFDYKEFYNSETFKNDIDVFINFKTINQFFKKQRKLILIDDLEILCSDKNILSYLTQIDNRNIPIVCIVNKVYSRKYNDFLKKTDNFYLNKPPMDKSFSFIISICDNESINIDKELISNIKNIIKLNNFNIKYILLNLKSLLDFSSQYSKINLSNVDDNLNNNLNNLSIDYNEVNNDLYDIINKLIRTKYDIENLEKLTINDITLISMLLHENMLNIFNKKNLKSTTNKILPTIDEIYINVLEDYCIADNIEKYIYNNYNWQLYRYLSIIKSYKMNYYYSLLHPYNMSYQKINFTQILTKSSLKFNYSKKKFIILDDYNLSNKYFDIFIQYLLKNIELKHTENNNYKLKDKYDKNYLDILKKYNKTFCIIDDKLLK